MIVGHDELVLAGMNMSACPTFVAVTPDDVFYAVNDRRAAVLEGNSTQRHQRTRPHYGGGRDKTKNYAASIHVRTETIILWWATTHSGNLVLSQLQEMVME
jgi:hypothetical protein